MRRTVVVCVCLTVAGLPGGAVRSATPASRGAGSYKQSTRIARASWELDFRFHDLERVRVRLPGDAVQTTYWYLLYEVINNTGREVDFFPSFRLVTDTLEVVVGGDRVSPSVYDSIAARHRKEYPFFAPPWKMIGPVLQGEANARASAAVFRAFDRNASSLTVYVAGLTGDSVRLANPLVELGPEALGDAKPYYVLRRTLAIRYDLPGDPGTRAMATPIRRGREWVMR
ncbi:MAG: hypothetical protein ACE5HE_04485 [Phycisphaerae bacterium]